MFKKIINKGLFENLLNYIYSYLSRFEIFGGDIVKKKLIKAIIVLLLIKSLVLIFVVDDYYLNLAELEINLTSLGLFLSLLALFILVVYDFDLLTRLAEIYSLDLNGIIVLQASSLSSREEGTEFADFKDQLSDFQSKYDYLSYELDYNLRTIKVDLRTPNKRLRITAKDDFLTGFVEELNLLLEKLPENNAISIDLNITGSLSNFIKEQEFVISNNQQQVGINKQTYRKGIIGRYLHID